MAEELDFNAMPFQRNFMLHQGDTIEYRFQLMIKEEGAAAVAFDLTGCTLKEAVKNTAGVKEIDDRVITPDVRVDGKAAFRTTAADSAAWDGIYEHEVELTVPAGNAHLPLGCVRTLLCGTIVVQTDIVG